jgi:hypothetical protein
MNKKLFFYIYNFTNKNKAAKSMGIFLAKYSQKIFIAIYLIGIVFVYKYNFNALIKFILVPLFTLVYNSFLRSRINKQRPFVVENIEPLIDHETSGSCPSNHGASSMIIAIAFFCINPYVAALLILLAVATGISRIMTGVHYPFDIFFSWIIALVIGTIGFLI